VHLQLRRHIHSLEELNRNLYEKAVNDGLTGLRNKRYFLEAFDEMFSRAMRIGIDLGCLFFDLDNFKKVNDTCGHGFGDYVLKTIGNLVREITSSGDLAARYGGEEFVIALPNGGLEQARSIAEQLRSQVEAFHFADQGQFWPVTLSVGVASLRAQTPATASALLQLADQALYIAKGTGRNRVVCSPD
jgi:two-component system cell cycle response regulator